MMTLDELQPNQKAIIRFIHLKDAHKKRLFHLGIYAGVTIRLESKAPLQDPSIYFVCGNQVVLRKQEARAIDIELEDIV